MFLVLIGDMCGEYIGWECVVFDFRSLVREIFPNHEMVVFQPRTLTTLYLGSLCLSLQYNLALLPHLFPYTVSGSSFPPIY